MKRRKRATTSMKEPAKKETSTGAVASLSIKALVDRGWRYPACFKKAMEAARLASPAQLDALLIQSCMWVHPEALGSLLALGADPNASREHGGRVRSAVVELCCRLDGDLIREAKNGDRSDERVRMLSALIAAGADVDAPTSTAKGGIAAPSCYPLDFACHDLLGSCACLLIDRLEPSQRPTRMPGAIKWFLTGLDNYICWHGLSPSDAESLGVLGAKLVGQCFEHAGEPAMDEGLASLRCWAKKMAREGIAIGKVVAQATLDASDPVRFAEFQASAMKSVMAPARSDEALPPKTLRI